MSPMTKAMIEAWFKANVQPLATVAMRASIPANQLAGAFMGVALRCAQIAGFTKEQFVELADKLWDASPPKADKRS
jgi:hypothetical protein